MGPFEWLFNIHLHHAYFGDGFGPPLSWQPTSETRVTMDNLGMLVRADGRGIAVYYDTQRTSAMALLAAQSSRGDAGLFFKIYSQDPFFYNYTQLPGRTHGTMLYLDSDQAVSEPDQSLRLHPHSHVSAQENRPMTEKSAQNVLTRRDWGTPPLGVIRIRLVGRDGCPMDAKGNIRPRHYHVHFDHRRTYWKYFISGPLASQSISIYDSARQWNFSPLPAKVPEAKGRTATFISSDPIPLRQMPTHTFQLRLKTANRSKVLINKLPVAPVDVVHRIRRGDEDVYTSEIFINS